MEYWDLYNKDGEKINKCVKRGEKLENDEYHLVVNAWIKNSEGKFLISKRSAIKKKPLIWECTGGSVLKGETSLQGALREVKEELGLTLNNENARHIGRTLRYFPGCNDILDVWLFEIDVSIENLILQKEEVCDVKWFTKEEIENLIKIGHFDYNAYYKEVLNGNYQ